MTEPVHPAPVANDSEAVTKARRKFGRLATVLLIVGVALNIIATVAWFISQNSPTEVRDEGSLAIAVFAFIGPVLVVMGLHMLVWRALARPMARMQSGARTGTIIGVGAGLAVISVPLVAAQVLAGVFIVGGITSAIG